MVRQGWLLSCFKFYCPQVMLLVQLAKCCFFIKINAIFFLWLDSSSRPRPPHCWGFDITLKHTTFSRTPLGVISRSQTMTVHNAHKRQTSVPLAGYEPTIPPNKRPQTHALAQIFPNYSVEHQVLHEASPSAPQRDWKENKINVTRSENCEFVRPRTVYR